MSRSETTVMIDKAPKTSPGAAVVQMLLGAAAGAATMITYVRFAERLHWADTLALCMALICLIGALRLFMRSFNPAGLGEMISAEGDSTEAEGRAARLQAAIFLCVGVSMALPPLAALQGPAPFWFYVPLLAATAAQVWHTIHVFRHGDEFQRQKIRELSFRASFVGNVLLLAYAGGERLGFFPALTAWDVCVALTAVTMAAPLIAPARRSEP